MMPLYFPVQAVFIQNLPEFIPVEIIGEFPVDEIVPFFAGGEIVHHQNVVYPHPVQFPDHGTADETGAARNNIHVNSPVIPPACPSVRGRQQDCLKYSNVKKPFSPSCENDILIVFRQFIDMIGPLSPRMP